VRAGSPATSRDAIGAAPRRTLIHLGSGWVLATLPVAAVQVHRGVLREEQQLADKFDDEFERYRWAVPRYLRAPHARR
jgi:protein-S-isoprenylcysteine O-methyltransferase Ste14